MHHGMPECHKPFLGHCDLDLWPSFKNYCVQSIFPILFDAGIPNLGWWLLFGWRSGANHFESLWPWHWLLASFLGFSCYITANFLQMCLMLDQFLWGHSSRVCDISCLIFENRCSVLFQAMDSCACKAIFDIGQSHDKSWRKLKGACTLSMYTVCWGLNIWRHTKG